MTVVDGAPEGEEVPASADRDAFFKSIKPKKPREISVRELLGLWGKQKRGAAITKIIERELAGRGLVSYPEIAKADYYGSVKILNEKDLPAYAGLDVGWPISSVLNIDRGLVDAGPDDSLLTVETRMVLQDLSQIPVLSRARRELYGAVTWKSIAQCPGPRSEATAKQAMQENIPTARSSDSLLDHIETIIENEFLLIRDPTNVYVGILTTTDLADSFQATSGPFVKIGEIERRLRILVNQLPLPAIQQAKLPTDSAREIGSSSDLNFGEYVRVLQNQDNWNKLGLAFDRATIIRNLEAVNEVRNDVMHFRPTPPETEINEANDAIDQCLNWLRTINKK
jgi:hypothetical protein